MKSRITQLFILVCCLLASLLFRAGYLQFLPQEKLNALQDRQFQTVVELPSRRGSIVDFEGKELAMSVPAFSVYADPKIIESKKEFVQAVSDSLKKSQTEIRNKIKDKTKRFVWLERLVAPDVVQKLKNKKIKGLGFVEEWRRVYPNDQMLANTIGFLGRESTGLEGLEHQFDKELKGLNKKYSMRKDARGRPLVQDGLLFTEMPQGQEVKLTIDSDLQYFVETELDSTIRQFQAEAGYVVILDAKTSAVRALASFPSYNLNFPNEASSERRRNRAVTDTFEPGSTIKAFVVAEALETKIVQPNSKIFCENGSFRIGNRTIKEAEKDHAQGTITITEVMQFSSNIGTAKLALKLGDDKVLSALKRFGFGERGGIDLPGEAKGILIKTPWRDHLTANISFGQGMTASPLQIANAYAAIANGGILNRPYIVESVEDFEEKKIEKTEPQAIRRVLSESTASIVKMMLAAVTSEKGTGYLARVPGYIVGGKTGTAQKVNPKGRGYIPGGYISSFAGFVPANDPQYVIYIAIDHPKKAFYGSQVAAPLFSKIASFKLRHSGVPAEILTESDLSIIPLEQNYSNQEKQKIFQEKELLPTYPEHQIVPDIEKMNLKEILKTANEKNIKLKFLGYSGDSKSVKTIPSPGEQLDDNRNMTVIFE